MPARITVSVLSELLGRSQALTDANREKLLERDAERRAQPKQLAAKKAKEDAQKRRRGGIDDPTGRNIFTAPAVLPRGGGVGVLWYSLGFASANNFGSVPPGDPYAARFVLELRVASANGLSVQTVSVRHDWTTLDIPGPTSPDPPVASGRQIEPILHLQFFPATDGRVLLTLDVREAWAYSWPENTLGATASTPGALIGKVGAVSSATTCNLVGVGATGSDEFALFNAFYPDFDDEGLPPWFGRAISGAVEILNAPPEVGIVAAYGPTAYAQNSTWAASPSSGGAATTIYQSILTNNGLPAEYPELTQGNWPPGTAPPTAPPVDQSSLEAEVTNGWFSGSSGSGDTSWTPIYAFDFGATAYVAAQYAALAGFAPPPPTP